MRGARRACPWTSSPTALAFTARTSASSNARSRQPTLAVAANLAEALGLSLSELVAEAENDVDNNDVAPAVEPVPARQPREAEPMHLREASDLTAVTGLTTAMVAQAIEIAYQKLDLIDEQMRESGSPPLARLVELSELSALISNLLSAGIAQASDGLYMQKASDQSPSLLPLRQGLPELEVAAALETDRPASGASTAGVYYLTFRYVLAGQDGTFTRGKESRGDMIVVWEVRFGEVAPEDFLRATRNGGAPLKKEALDGMELVYYDPELLPYAKPIGVYARIARE